MKNKNTLIFLGILPFLVGGCTLQFFNKPNEEQKEQEQDMIPEEPENREDILRNANDVKDGQIRLPKVVK